MYKTEMTTLNQYLKENYSATFYEGHCQQVADQVNILRSMASFKNVSNIMEIGFNAGHSSEVFLGASPRTKVVSFDIGSHDYLTHGKTFIDRKFPDRHQLILGDSEKTVAEYIENKPDTRFDLIFIDGSHVYEKVMQDLLNCKRLSHKDTIIILDDVVKNPSYKSIHNSGPSQIWAEFIKEGIVREISSVEFNTQEGGRGMAWGKYILE